ncbi:hypothetical protein FQR65_LT13269 [Abscondita terminalis]|nr:hypothetical protein FQR65_LT13269 [Abscondita terminalis]
MYTSERREWRKGGLSLRGPTALLSSLLQRSWSKNLTTPYTGPIICRENVMWLVPKGRRMPALRVITGVFQKTVWYSMVLSILIISFTCLLILKSNCFGKNYKFTLILLNIWRATVLGSVYKVSSHRGLWYLLISYVIYCVYMQVMFTSKLFQSLTVPQYERGIQNFKELYESKIPIIVNNRLRDKVLFYQNLKNDDHYDKMSKRIKFVREKKFDRVFMDCFKKRQCATFVVGYEDYQNTTFFNSSRTIKDDSVTGNIHYLLTLPFYNSDIITIKKLMYMFFECGITNDFGKRLEMNRSKRVIESRSVVLTLDHIYIVCMMLVIGLVFSVVVFFCEIFMSI